MSQSRRTAAYKPALFYFSVFTMVWAILLLYAGAYTTSIQAGMAFLDWPLSNSSINPEGWLTQQDMRAEHGHRLFATLLGVISIILVVWTQLQESRKTVRTLAIFLLIAISSQGVLGGLRVLLDQLNTGADSNIVAQTFAVLHACGAELTVCLVVTFAVLNSRSWIENKAGLEKPVSASLRQWGWIASITVFIQIILGAVMRHAGAGLAIPTFPLTPEGSLFPAIWNFPLTIHWLHRFGAIVTTVVLLIFIGKVLGTLQTRAAWGKFAWILTALLALQIALGVATILTHKNPVMASTHMLVGAFVLAVTWMLTFLTYRIPLQGLENSPESSRSANPKQATIQSI